MNGFLYANTDIDMNSTDSSTEVVRTTGFSMLSFGVTSESGTHGTHVVKLQASFDGTNYYDVPGATITGEGAIFNIPISYPFAKVVVSLRESAASKSTIDIFAI